MLIEHLIYSIFNSACKLNEIEKYEITYITTTIGTLTTPKSISGQNV